MGVFKVRRIVLEWIGIDFFLFDQAVSEIFYTSNAKKWSLIESYAMVFIANPDVKKSINVSVANKNKKQ